METERIIELLKEQGQIILQGAPGTGKTYATVELAVALCCPGEYTNIGSDRKKLKEKYDDLVKKGQVAFTTFHQSMDYEDFVEGYKPTTKEERDNGEGDFKLRDGIFKKICKKAKNPQTVPIPIEQQFDWAWDELLKKHPKVVDQKQRGKCQIIDIDNGEFVFKNNAQRNNDSKVNGDLKTKKQDIKAIYLKFPADDPQTVTEEKYRQATRSSAFTTDWAFYKMVHDYIVENQNSIPKEKCPCLLIIDEINRANISKVMGELITLLEKGKREGNEDARSAKLPYSQEEFTVPDNLYIIGTMNTADRSLGSIDYAIRRRFAFVTLEADNSLLNNLQYKACFKKVRSLIEECRDDDFEVDEIMVGHSYFMPKSDEEWQRNIDYKIIPLLLEYFKDGVLIDKNNIFTVRTKTKKDQLKDYLHFSKNQQNAQENEGQQQSEQ